MCVHVAYCMLSDLIINHNITREVQSQLFSQAGLPTQGSISRMVGPSGHEEAAGGNRICTTDSVTW